MGEKMQENEERSLVSLIVKSRRILIFSGAGISTTSGIPDYRGPKGVWKKTNPVYYNEFMNSSDARLRYWEQKSESWDVLKRAKPTMVHAAIVDLERAEKLHMVVTQNIDSLHRLAGNSEERLVELHGSMGWVECQSCHRRFEPDPLYSNFRRTHHVPMCDCGGYLKPATISFGQNLKEEDLARAFRSAEGADLVIALGSTLSVTPASLVPLRAAERGIPYVIINRGKTDHDELPVVLLRLEGDVESIFPPAVEKALSINITGERHARNSYS
jgi:NAD-dependent deacetylase